MKKNRIFNITFCAILAAMAIALDKVTSFQVTPAIKITYYALPLLVVGVLYGPFLGLMTGLVSGTVMQLTSQYGVSLSSPFWALAPVCWGLVSGLVYLPFKKKQKWIGIVLAVVFASIAANLVNTFAMLMDALLVKDSWYTTSAIMLDWPGRLLTMVVAMVPYILITGIVVDSLRRIYHVDEDDEEDSKEEINE